MKHRKLFGTKGNHSDADSRFSHNSLNERVYHELKIVQVINTLLIHLLSTAELPDNSLVYNYQDENGDLKVVIVFTPENGVDYEDIVGVDGEIYENVVSITVDSICVGLI